VVPIPREFSMEWHATLPWNQAFLSFSPPLDFFDKWALQLVDEEKLELAAYLCPLSRGNPSLHVLMVGRNRGGKIFTSCDRRVDRLGDSTRGSDGKRQCQGLRLCRTSLHGVQIRSFEVESFDRTLLHQVMRPRNDYSKTSTD